MVSSSSSTGSNRISFGGIASGIDTQALIDALIQVESAPINAAQSRLALQQQRKAALATVNSSIANLLSTANALKDTSVVGAKSATVNQPTTEASKVSASASASAAVGSFTLDILSLATATKTTSTAATGLGINAGVVLENAGFTTPVTEGTFSVNGTTFTIDEFTVLSDGADLLGANTILAKINNAGIGVTASIQNDADGRANLLQLTSGASIQLGSGGDTSNFLAAANLLQSPGTTTRTSTRPLAGVSQSAALEDARLATALGASSGSFTINGVSIAWDAEADSLGGVISRINSAGAGVTASFDVVSDRLVLTANATGSATIALADVTGNFLDALEVLAASPILGANASYKINGGTTQYASKNTVTDAVSGVTLSLQNTTSSPVTVTVNADNTALRNRIATFVSQYNSTVGVLADSSKYVQGGKNGPLLGDPLVQRMLQALRTLVTTAATGITGNMSNLTAIGLNFGSVGAAIGTTKSLAFDTAKFDAAMASNPAGVARLLASFQGAASLDPGGAGSIASITGTPTVVPDSGKYTIASTAAGVLTVSYQPDNGGPLVVSSGNLTAGGTNTTIIPGVTITAKPVLVDGTDTITITATEEGIGKRIAEYLNLLTATGGTIAATTAGTDANITDINAQIEKLNLRVEAKRRQLQLKFTNLEVTLQRLQGQQSTLTQLQASLTPKK